MAIDYIRDVQPLEGVLPSDAFIAAHLSNRTARPISCAEAKILLEETGLVVEDPITRTRSGTLVDRYNAMTNPDLKALLGWFIAHVFGRGDQISSNTNPRAIQLAAVLADLPPDLADVGTQLLALGGGQPHAGTTEQDVITARSNYEFQQTQDAAVQVVNTKAGNAMNAARSAKDQGLTPAEIAAAAESAWSVS